MSSINDGGTLHAPHQSNHDSSFEGMHEPYLGQAIDEGQAEEQNSKDENNNFNPSWKLAWFMMCSSSMVAWIAIYSMISINHWSGFVLLSPVLAISLLAMLVGWGCVVAHDDSALSTKDAYLMAAYFFIILWTTICVMVATDHWAGYVFLAPVLLLSFFGTLYGAVVAQSRAVEEHRSMRLKTHISGERLPLLHPNIRTRIITPLCISTLSLCFGLLGTYLTGRHLLGSWYPDFSQIDAGPSFALYLWFAIFAILGLALPALMVLMTPFLLGMKFYRMLRPAARHISELDQSKPPEIPQIGYPVYPIVDCLAPLYAGLPFAILVTVGGFYSRWYLLAGIGFCIASFASLRTHRRVAREFGQLQLYSDWHNAFATNGEVDENILALMEERREVNERYENSAGGFCVMWLFGFFPLLMLQSSTDIKEISWGWLYFGTVLFLGNYIVYTQWRQELLRLLQFRTLKMGGANAYESEASGVSACSHATNV